MRDFNALCAVCMPAIRGLSGGFVFAIPTIYTMEVWWLGFHMATWKVIAFLACGLVMAFGLNLFSGFREDPSLADVAADALGAIALGLVISAVMLWLMAVVDAETNPLVALRMVAVMAVPTAVGVSLARTLLMDESPENEGRHTRAGLNGKAAERLRRNPYREDIADIGMTAIGGLFLGLSVAPTEEILTIATQGTAWHLLGLATLTLALSYVLVFEAGFIGQSERRAAQGFLQRPWPETCMSYGVALLVSLGLLGFMGFLGGEASLYERLAMAIVLGLPAAIGGAAARMIL